jgi:hypothetical protein
MKIKAAIVVASLSLLSVSAFAAEPATHSTAPVGSELPTNAQKAETTKKHHRHHHHKDAKAAATTATAKPAAK